ncbi:amidase [Haliangium sp.]|uniref:amidase n=1 Tax=Haliangium sp. TaxID=2663208 RepID=UPI003D113BB3
MSAAAEGSGQSGQAGQAGPPGQPGGDDVLRESASELAARLHAGTLCPVELAEATLARISEVDPVVNAMCTVADDVLVQAEAARAAIYRGDEVGPLCGLPVGIKDVTATAGLRTTYASPLFAHHVPDRDALLVARLRAAGAVIVGKTNTPEMAVGAHTDNEVFGPTRNPWDPSRTVGGSSGGSAAALACGMVALADGTDVGGSLRIPAAYCGVVGLRPSPGLVPILPSPDRWDDIQAAGPMGRTVADVAMMLQVMAGPAPGLPMSRSMTGRDFPAAAARPLRSGLRVGWCPDLSGRGVEPALVHLGRRVLDYLSDSGAEIADVELDLSAGHEVFATLRGLWMLAQHLDLVDRLDELGPNLAGNIRVGLGLDPTRIARAMRARSRLMARVARVLAEVDVVVTPTVAVPPFAIADGPPMAIRGQPMSSYIDWIAPTYLLTLTSLPVLAVPCGRDQDGLPAGVQIVGPVDGEELVLEVGAALERRQQALIAPLTDLSAASSTPPSSSSPPRETTP